MKITSIKQQIKRANRYSIFVDGAYAFSLSESGLLASRLASGQELDEEQLADLKRASGEDKAYGSALRYVVMRPRSVWEIETYLKRKDVAQPVAEQIIQRLQDADLLNDLTFANTWVANRRLLRSTSKRKLQLELKQKHVPESIISQALREAQTNERDALREVVEKKQHRYPDQNKFMQYLARQGFGYDDIKAVLGAEQADDY